MSRPNSRDAKERRLERRRPIEVEVEVEVDVAALRIHGLTSIYDGRVQEAGGISLFRPNE